MSKKNYLFHLSVDVKEFIKDLKGKPFKVWFVKDDGTLRKMSCKVDLKFKPKKLKEGEKRKKLPETSIFIWDLEQEAYRSFRSDRVVYLCHNL